jgi:hypothetical protein
MSAQLNQEIFERVRDYFGGNGKKAFLWLQTVNPALGGVSPLWMMSVGRSNKLLKFVKGQLEGS